MPIPKTSAKSDDFNPAEIAPTVEAHGKDIIDLSARVDALERRLGNNETLADAICLASEKATSVQGMLGKTVIRAIESNADVQTALTSFLEKSDRKTFRLALSKSQTAIGYVLSAIVGWVLSHFFGK